MLRSHDVTDMLLRYMLQYNVHGIALQCYVVMMWQTCYCVIWYNITCMDCVTVLRSHDVTDMLLRYMLQYNVHGIALQSYVVMMWQICYCATWYNITCMDCVTVLRSHDVTDMLLRYMLQYNVHGIALQSYVVMMWQICYCVTWYNITCMELRYSLT